MSKRGKMLASYTYDIGLDCPGYDQRQSLNVGVPIRQYEVDLDIRVLALEIGDVSFPELLLLG